MTAQIVFVLGSSAEPAVSHAASILGSRGQSVSGARCLACDGCSSPIAAKVLVAVRSVSALIEPHLLACRAGTDFTSVFIVWATGHVTETLPDLPYTTNPYNTNPLNKSAPGAAQSPWHITSEPILSARWSAGIPSYMRPQNQAVVPSPEIASYLKPVPPHARHI